MGAFKEQAIEFAERFDEASDAIERLMQDEPDLATYYLDCYHTQTARGHISMSGTASASAWIEPITAYEANRCRLFIKEQIDFLDFRDDLDALHSL